MTSHAPLPRIVAGSTGIVTGVTTHVSKWDRPPEPKDWRYFVGGAGRVLIALGLLMFGFVAYQLWGTGIETARAQNQLENEFEQLVADTETATSPPTTAAQVRT